MHFLLAKRTRTLNCAYFVQRRNNFQGTLDEQQYFVTELSSFQEGMILRIHFNLQEMQHQLKWQVFQMLAYVSRH